jgi:Mitochondrial K+-H+ exchange-related
MNFFFVRDYLDRYRFFSSEPQRDISIPASRTKRAWELAQKKLTVLPPRILRQEQAFIRILKIADETVKIHHSGLQPEKRIRLRFSLFLHKQRTKHILVLIGETLLLPLSGLAALLPGPNVAFAALALLMITHWRALQGINRLAKKKHEFPAAPLFAEWESACGQAPREQLAAALKKIEDEYHLSQLNRILWKKEASSRGVKGPAG